ncbi:MAG: hypothetical protein ABI743_11930 [bacterium]
MRQWPRYPDLSVEQRRALWALDQRERRSERRWRQQTVLMDPSILADIVSSDHRVVADLAINRGLDDDGEGA